MTKQRKVAFYFRVSTMEQTTENQRRDLTSVAERASWAIVEIYEFSNKRYLLNIQ